tara:strand:+ start:1366 stop:2079 length:714 start_codon:yes stop_codon:yes gene_type:complete
MAKFAKFLEGTAFGLLNDLLAGFHSDDGYAQPNRYEVVINGPRTLNQQNPFEGLQRQSDVSRIALRAQSAVLPGRVLNTAEDTNIYGPSRQVVDGVTYAGEIDIEFQSSSDLQERVFFENWQRQTFNEKTWNLQYYDDYTGELEIYILDKQDQRRYGVKLWEVFPKTVNPTSLAYDANDTLFLTSVGFSFRYWTSLDQSQNPDVSFFDRALETVVNSAERNLTRNVPAVLNKLGRIL